MSVRVNLLPEARLIKLRNQQTRRVTTMICSVIVIGVVAALVVLLILLGARNIQAGKNEEDIKKLQNEIAAKKSTELDVARFNDGLSESIRLSDNRILVSQIFDRLTAALPKNVRMTDLTVDPTYKVKASVGAPDYNTVALFGNALATYNTGVDEKRNIQGLERKAVFTDIKVDSVTSSKTSQTIGAKMFDVTFQVDKGLVQKLREANKASGGTNGS